MADGGSAPPRRLDKEHASIVPFINHLIASSERTPIPPAHYRETPVIKILEDLIASLSPRRPGQ